MSIAYKIRRSAIGKRARQIHHSWFRLRHAGGEPVSYKLPLNTDLLLYPEGEIAAFLALQTSFETTELALVASYLQQGMKVADVGANIGLYSILAQKRVGAAGTIWAFEPSHETFQLLERNLELNDCKQVVPSRCALSDRADVVLQLTSDKGFGDAYRYLKYQHREEEPADPNAEQVPVSTLDKWASDNGVGSLDFLKVDIEGGEFRMFSGAQNILRASRDIVILFESDPQWSERSGVKQQATFELLQNIGLGLYAWDTKQKDWRTDQASLLESEMIWACFERERLPSAAKVT